MVVKVIGKVDSKDVIFHDEGMGRWSVTVPYDQDGEYIVEVTAIDDAGNIAHATKYLLIVNVEKLVCKLIKIPYVSVLLQGPYESERIESPDFLSVFQNTWISDFKENDTFVCKLKSGREEGA